MIRHYDMTSGEMIVDETEHSPLSTLRYPVPAGQLRLMPVQNICGPGPETFSLPADLADIPVDAVLAKFDRGL